MAKMVVTERKGEIEEFISVSFWQGGVSYENERDDILYFLFLYSINKNWPCVKIHTQNQQRAALYQINY